MKSLIAALFALLIFSTLAQNACLVDAAQLQAVYSAQYRLEPYYFTRIVIISWNPKTLEKGEPGGHAVCIFQLGSHLFGYDPVIGSQEININFKRCPFLIAYSLYGPNNVQWADFLDE